MMHESQGVLTTNKTGGTITEFIEFGIPEIPITQVFILKILANGVPMGALDIEEKLPREQRTPARNRIYWHLTRLKALGYIKNTQTSSSTLMYTITPEGKRSLIPPKSDEEVAYEFAETLALRTGKRKEEVFEILLKAISQIKEEASDEPSKMEE